MEQAEFSCALPENEADLVSLVQAGDQQAFAVLVARCEPMLRAQVARFSPSVSDVEDMLQEALLALLSAARSYQADKGAGFRTYASVCVRNRLLTLARRVPKAEGIQLEEAVDFAANEQESDPAALLVERESAEQLLVRIKKELSAREYAVFLQYLNGESYNRIAATLGVSNKVVDNALQRARRKLQNASIL